MSCAECNPYTAITGHHTTHKIKTNPRYRESRANVQLTERANMSRKKQKKRSGASRRTKHSRRTTVNVVRRKRKITIQCHTGHDFNHPFTSQTLVEPTVCTSIPTSTCTQIFSRPRPIRLIFRIRIRKCRCVRARMRRGAALRRFFCSPWLGHRETFAEAASSGDGVLCALLSSYIVINMSISVRGDVTYKVAYQ